MFCDKCGAGLRETDRFCSRCGAPVEGYKPTVSEHLEEARKEPKEIYYDEKLYRDDKGAYRDSFLSKKEEKSHALLVTLSVLLIMIVLAAGFLVVFFFVKRGSAGGPGNEIEILADSGQNQGQSGGTDDIVILQAETEALAEGVNEGETKAEAADPNAPAMQAVDSVQAETASDTHSETSAQEESETETSKQADAGALDMAEIERMLGEAPGIAKGAVYVYDLQHNREYATQGCEEPMYASALICVPVLYTSAVLLDQGQMTLNDPVTYVNSIGGRGEAYPESKDGQSFPLSYYLTTMMSYSDNNCVNCLIDYLGLDTVNTTCRMAGFGSVDLQRKIVAEVTDGKDNYVSAKDLAGMVRQLYLGKFQNISREFMKRYFRIDEGDGYRTVLGLAYNLPGDATFLNHNGRGDTRYNEVAVVEDASCQYIISVMCSGDYGFSYENALEEISAYVYERLSQLG